MSAPTPVDLGLEISVLRPDGKVEKKLTSLEKAWAQGIRVSRMFYHPDCPFCGLEDAGKEALERPTEIHMLGCKERALIDVPMERASMGFKKAGIVISGDPDRPVRGTFRGQALMGQIRYPTRRIGVFYPIDEKTGEPKETWYCIYSWKTGMVPHRVWNGKDWVPWYSWSPEKPDKKAVLKAMTPQAEKWLKMFMRPKEPK